MNNASTLSRLSDSSVRTLAFASAVVTANAYYIHPIISEVATSFGVGAGSVGIVPALNQVALALGVLLLLPLGDRVRNDRLVAACLSAQVAALIVMALAERFTVFIAASTVLGFFTVTPYLLPAWTSKRVEPNRLGFVTALLTTGVIAGVQLSRLTSGVVADWIEWRAVYWLAATLMAVSAVLLPRIMAEPASTATPVGPNYWQLLGSLGTLFSQHPRVMTSGLIQGLNFAIFISSWLGISLYLTSDGLGYGTDLVGYLTAFSAIGLLTTARLGRWADGKGPERARLIMALIQYLGVVSLWLVNLHWLYLLIPLTVMSIVGPLVDVTGRMTSLRTEPAVRTRLMSLYVTMMFLGGGLGSWLGTQAYAAAGWPGSVALATLLSASVCLLSLQQSRLGKT